ncbi:MAG: hypothetical protein LC785_04065 [Acidobacteria bacterium]|nr:hypothetical protein [Acidobacteriota bacterium]MCA1641160.1 hypothetical protein [Acidobacteriota bacterium]
MIDVKQAAQLASDFIVGLYSDQTISDVRLEEIELSEDERHWLITLSFPSPVTSNVLGLPVAGRRQYKILKVDRESGEVLSMKIRELAHEAA